MSSVLRAERRFAKLPNVLINHRWLLNKGLFSILPLLMLIGPWYCWNIWAGLGILVISLPMCVLFITGKSGDIPKRYDNFFALYSAVSLTFGAVVWMILSLKLSLNYSTLLMVIFLPLFWVMFLGPMIPIMLMVEKLRRSILYNFVEDYGPTVAMALAVSFTITYLAFLLGNIGKPDAPLPKTFQMLISNVIFDGATMLATLIILRWAVSKSSVLRLPLAITVDILIAGILACCSLYFGLLYSNNALMPQEVINVLIAKSPSGSEFELSPYFWAMHTSFLPTIIYLSIILMCWVGKVILQPVVWFFGVGRTLKNPLKLTITVLTLFSVFLGALSYGAGAIEDRLKEKEKSEKIELSLNKQILISDIVKWRRKRL